MNVLILTGKFGLGHFSAAKAIEEKILLEHPEYNVKIVDIIEYIFPHAKTGIYSLFNFLVNKCPSIYNVFGTLLQRGRNAPLKNIVAKKIDLLLKGNKTNAVISTLPMCSQYISSYKKIYHSNIILNTFITDIEIHEEWINDYTDMYFVPSYRTRNYLLKKGVEPSKIIVSGVPTKIAFKASKRRKKEKRILIMGGGLGLIPNASEFLDYLSNIKNVKVTLIVGKNEKLFHKYNHKYENVEVIGFTNEVSKYMKNADLMITKAGGVTLFEAIQTETPLFVLKPFLTQEMGNAKFIQEKQIGEVVWRKKETLSMDIINLLMNEEKLSSLRHNMRIVKTKMDKKSYLFNMNGEISC